MLYLWSEEARRVAKMLEMMRRLSHVTHFLRDVLLRYFIRGLSVLRWWLPYILPV